MSWLMRLMGTTNTGEVDAQGQQRVIPYDATGSSLAPINRAAVLEGVGGLVGSGRDYKLARTLRVSPTGAASISGDETMLLFDSFEGTTRDLMQWIETAATMASAQAVATGLTLNSGSSVTTAQGILQSSHRFFPFGASTSITGRWHLRVQGTTNCFAEWGFSDQTSATTALHNNGAFFRRDGAGSLQPILAFNGAETAGSVMAGVATTDYNTYHIHLSEFHARFEIVDHNGVLIASQTMEIGATGAGAGVKTQARMLAATRIPAMMRVYNSGAAGTAPQIVVNLATVLMLDVWSQRDHAVQQAGLGLDGVTSPTLHTQLANWTNSGAPTTRTLANATAAEATLGGLLRVNSIAGGNTDYVMFGWQNPTPYTFYCTGIIIPPPLNEVVAVATTATIFAYFAAFNSSAVSLATAAPYTPMRIALPGIHTAAVALAANAIFTGANAGVMFNTPKMVAPGRFLHVGCRELVGTATATETYLWGGVIVEGFFE